MVDSGSTVSLLRYGVFDNDILQRHKACGVNSVHLMAANGQPLEVTTCVQLPVQFSTLTKIVRFYVVKDLSVPGILGQDFLRQTGAVVDFANDVLKVGNTEIYLVPGHTQIDVSEATTGIDQVSRPSQPIYEDRQITVCRASSGRFVVSWHWSSTPPTNSKGLEPFLTRLDQEHQRRFHEQVDYYVKEKIIEEVSPDQLQAYGKECFYLKWFAVVQKSTSTPARPIWDFRPINEAVYHGPMRQQLLGYIQQQLRLGSTLIAFDITKAFLAIDLSPDLGRFTLFKYQSRTFKHRRLGFGVCIAPHGLEICLRLLFQEHDLHRRLYEGGWLLVQYMDDLFLVAMTDHPTMSPSQAANLVIKVLAMACFTVQTKKTRYLCSLPDPSSVITIDSGEVISPVEEAVLVGVTYNKSMAEVCYDKEDLSIASTGSDALTLRRVLAVISKLRDPLLLRPLTSVVNNNLKRIIGSSPLGWDDSVSSDDSNLWLSRIQRLEELNKVEPSYALGLVHSGGTLLIYVDASTTGYAWLAYYGGDNETLSYLGGEYGLWPAKHQGKHINYLELLASVKACNYADQHYIKTFKPSCIYHVVDSQACFRQLVSGRAHQTAHSVALCQRQLSYHAELTGDPTWKHYNVVLVPTSINVADRGTRLQPVLDYVLCNSDDLNPVHLQEFLPPRAVDRSILDDLKSRLNPATVSTTSSTERTTSVSLVCAVRGFSTTHSNWFAISDLRREQQQDQVCQAIRDGLQIADIKPFLLSSCDPDEVRLLWKYRASLDVQDGLLVRRYAPFPYYGVLNIPIIPARLRQQLLIRVHERGHYGSSKLYDQLTRISFWPTMRSDCLQFVKACPICSLRQGPPRPVPLRLHYATRPWQLVSVDVLTIQRHKLLTLCCHFSKWAFVIPLRDETVSSTVTGLLKVFNLFGPPDCLLADRGVNFTHPAYVKAMTDLGIMLRYSSVAHPASNGQVERFHRSLLDRIRSYILAVPGGDWFRHLSQLVYQYNTVRQDSIGISPYEAMFGRPPHQDYIPFLEGGDGQSHHDEVHATIIDYINTQLDQAKAAYRRQYDLKTDTTYDFPIGSNVLIYFDTVRSKVQPHWKRGFQVLSRLSLTNYRLQSLASGHIFTCHVNRLRLDPAPSGPKESVPTRPIRLLSTPTSPAARSSDWYPTLEEEEVLPTDQAPDRHPVRDALHRVSRYGRIIRKPARYGYD